MWNRKWRNGEDWRNPLTTTPRPLPEPRLRSTGTNGV